MRKIDTARLTSRKRPPAERTLVQNRFAQNLGEWILDFPIEAGKFGKVMKISGTMEKVMIFMENNRFSMFHDFLRLPSFG